MKKVFYSPVENTTPIWRYAGLFLRTLITYMGTIGLSALILGAAGISYPDWWGAVAVKAGHIALLAIPAALACAVASTGRIAAAVTPVVYAGAYAGIVTALYGDPVIFTVKSALRVYNMALYRMSTLGYAAIGSHMVPDGYDYTQSGNAISDPYRFGGAFLVITLIALFLYFTVQRKVRVIPLAIGIGLILAPILTYNIGKGNAGIGFTICLICGALGMKFYDRAYSGVIERRQKKREERKARRLERKEARKQKREEKRALIERAQSVYETAAENEMGLKVARKAKSAVLKAHRDAAKKAKKEEKQRIKEEKKEAKKSPDRAAEKEERRRRRYVSYMGGFAGAACAAVVFLALWIPMASVSGNFRVIDSINNRVQIVRTYVTAYLHGNDIDLNQLYAYGIDDLAPRKLSFDPLEYRDRRLFRVESETDNNVYLRSWIGTHFDFKEEEWTSADTDTVLAYREQFGKEFSPDEITHNFTKYVYPSSTVFEDGATYKNFGKFGFNVQKVNVWRVSGKSLLLFVPAHMNTDVGLTAYGEPEDADFKYSRYYEGVYSSRFFKYGMGYGTVSYVTAFNRAESGEELDNSVRYWDLAKKYITSASPDASQGEIDALLYDFDTEAKDLGIEYLGVSLPERYFNSMSDTEKEELTEAYALEEKYAEFAKTSYCEKSGNAVVEEIAAEIKDKVAAEKGGEAGGEASANELCRGVADYFRDGYTFTLTPDAWKYDGSKTVLEAFLADVKEGYSTHFATAAIAILREYGIPARYAEGLVAHEFTEAPPSAVSDYRSYVEDNDASAWVEAYIDGMGWVQYEVCPGELAEGMYDPKSATLTEEDLIRKDDEDTDPFGEGEKHESVYDILERLGKLTEKQPGESDFQWFVRRTVPILIVLVILYLISIVLRYFYRRAQKALGERYAVIEKVQNPENENNPNVDYAALTKKIDEMILEVFDLIGEGPEKGEMPAEFAERIARDYPDLSNIDPREVLVSMEKAEFGHGIGFKEADRSAEYLKDITDNLYGRLKFFQKIKLRYIRRKL